MRQAGVLKRVASGLAAILAASLIGGCGVLDIASFIDPTEMYPYTKKTLQKPIISSLSTLDPSVDDPTEAFYNVTEVRPSDLLAISADYKIGKGDLVNISVNDLVGLGVETTKSTRVSESGNVSMPLLGQIQAVGLTEDELQKKIANAYKDGQIITNAQVSVQVIEPRARTFSSLGSVGSPGQYTIPQSDFRIEDALVMMRDVPNTIDEVYIIRQISEDPPAGTTAAPVRPVQTPAPAVTPATPPVDPFAPKGDVVSMAKQANTPVMLQTADPLSVAPAAAKTDSFSFGTPTGQPETRTIRVPLGALRRGEFKYNVVIRPHDLIIAPNPLYGTFYMSGHIARVGVYGVPPGGITIKQAIVSAGMLDGVAIPQRAYIVRRIGPAREVFVAIDVNAIWAGGQPDIFLKNNDIVHVGTNILAPFIAAVRGGFRITYGFGFLYDKNFS